MKERLEDLGILAKAANSRLAELIARDLVGNVGAHENRNVNVETGSNLVGDKTKTVLGDVDTLKE